MHHPSPPTLTLGYKIGTGTHLQLFLHNVAA
ncbi:hypothetical protein FOCG_13653 [Fusarium oxysporum f. sp. radicis-lycopersici 26381]|nr:hypothetical protein FOCG_13653 [Fusarium oxysporum f. sp. radicis-lycopersici 26381]